MIPNDFITKNYSAAIIQVKDLDKGTLEKLAAFAYCTHLVTVVNLGLPMFSPKDFGEYLHELYMEKINDKI